jgi:tetratricopeptide (TPR) repeat protein
VRTGDTTAAGDLLYDNFKVHGTPTVLVANNAGQEIDRIIGYGPPAKGFIKSLEKSTTGENTFLALSQKLAQEPDNLEIMARLMYKYETCYDYKPMREFSQRILVRPEEARKIKIAISNHKVTAYEYAQYVKVHSSPQGVMDFLHEFPETELRTPAVQVLQNYYSNGTKKQEVFGDYRELLKTYPDDGELLTAYVRACAELKTDLEPGITAGEKFYQDHRTSFNNQLSLALAELLLMKGEENRALQVYGPLTVARHLKKSPEALNEYAWFWAQKGKNLTDAEAAARRSLKLKDDANVWDTLSMVLWKQGKPSNAIAAEEKALQLAGGKNEDFEKRIKDIRKDIQP